MGTCVAIIVIVSLCMIVFSEFSNAAEQKANEIKEYKYEIESLNAGIEDCLQTIRTGIKDYFKNDKVDNSALLYVEIVNHSIKEMESDIDKMEYTNKCLKRISKKENYENQINVCKGKVYSNANEQIDKFNNFLIKVQNAKALFDRDDYGIINEKRLLIIKNMDRNTIEQSISKYDYLFSDDSLTQNRLELIYQINPVDYLCYIWHYATEKVYSATDFSRAKKLFLKICKTEHVEVLLAELYAKKNVGGEDALREPVRELLKRQQDSQTLTMLASGFMWMKAYQMEAMILKHMLENGMEMSPKAQERLQILSNGGGSAPDNFNVHSEANKLYFDVSSLSWREDEYKGFFDNLAFRDMRLTYSLTIRDEDKELFIAQGISVPKDSDIHSKLKILFEEEYGSTVDSFQIEATALSGSGEEKLNGILICSKECRQMGIFVHLVKIGKKVDIKFYTLLMPENISADEQLQKALSLQKKLSPTVNMWESSLKDTTLIGIQQLLNAESQTTHTSENQKFNENVNSNEPVF